jgi:choline-sulfatase
MEQGFKVWRTVPKIDIDYNTDPYVTSQKLTPLAIEILSDKELTAKPFFAWFHYMDPHDKYQQHDESPKFGNKARDRYDSEMFYTDLWVNKLLTWVNEQSWGKKTVVIITADHGEAFGEHQIYKHAFELYDVLVHVPMFFVIPGQGAREIETPRSHIDLVPTIFELLGAKPTPELTGTSFKDELFGAPSKPRDIISDWPEDSYNERRRSFIHDGWKLIAYGPDSRYKLFHISEDPEEKKELFKVDKDKAKEMVELYKAASSKLKEQPIPGGVPKGERKLPNALGCLKRRHAGCLHAFLPNSRRTGNFSGHRKHILASKYGFSCLVGTG